MKIKLFKAITAVIALIIIALATFGAWKLSPLLNIMPWLFALVIAIGSTVIVFFMRMMIVWDFEDKYYR
jgi:hypothetical protein